MTQPPASEPLPIVLVITGASGAIYAARTLQWLLEEGRRVHLTVSPDGLTVIRQELGFEGPLGADCIEAFLQAAQRLLSGDWPRHASAAAPPPPIIDWGAITQALGEGRLKVHSSNDYFVPIASGSYRTSAMVICPCSGVHWRRSPQGRNLIHQAAGCI